MTRIGCHASHEQFMPRDLLELVQRAEQAGFDAAMSSDHSIRGASRRVRAVSVRAGSTATVISWGRRSPACRQPDGKSSFKVLAQSGGIRRVRVAVPWPLVFESGDGLRAKLRGLME